MNKRLNFNGIFTVPFVLSRRDRYPSTMSLRRRQALVAIGTSVASAAGCLDRFAETATTSTPTESPPQTPTTLNPEAPSLESAIQTPAPGECEATPPPKPEEVPPELEDDLSVRPYPSKPPLDQSGVSEFLSKYDAAYWTNRVIDELQPDESDDVDVNPEITVRDVQTREKRHGFVGAVDTTLLYSVEPSERYRKDVFGSGFRRQARFYGPTVSTEGCPIDSIVVIRPSRSR